MDKFRLISLVNLAPPFSEGTGIAKGGIFKRWIYYMSYFHSYIQFIIFIKFLFIVLAISHIYMKMNNKADSDLDKKIVYWKKRDEFIFEVLMALLLIYLFNPMYDHKELFDSHVKILLFIFGFILLITAKWSYFFGESLWFKYLQNTIGDEH
jgi:hypothetical protein